METKYDDGREEIFKKTEFMPPADVAEIKSVADSNGKPWCIFSTSESWAIRPASAKIHAHEPSLDVSIRLKWADDKSFVPPSGETPITGVWKVAELMAFHVRHPRLAYFAFPLSIEPRTINVS